MRRTGRQPPAQMRSDAIKLGPLAATQRACSEALMNQETGYLNALQGCERFEWKDPYLLMYCKGLNAPLRFRRMLIGSPAIEFKRAIQQAQDNFAARLGAAHLATAILASQIAVTLLGTNGKPSLFSGQCLKAESCP
jgi:hypothetical protein